MYSRHTLSLYVNTCRQRIGECGDDTTGGYCIVHVGAQWRWGLRDDGPAGFVARASADSLQQCRWMQRANEWINLFSFTVLHCQFNRIACVYFLYYYTILYYTNLLLLIHFDLYYNTSTSLFCFGILCIRRILPILHIDFSLLNCSWQYCNYSWCIIHLFYVECANFNLPNK